MIVEIFLGLLVNLFSKLSMRLESTAALQGLQSLWSCCFEEVYGCTSRVSVTLLLFIRRVFVTLVLLFWRLLLGRWMHFNGLIPKLGEIIRCPLGIITWCLGSFSHDTLGWGEGGNAQLINLFGKLSGAIKDSLSLFSIKALVKEPNLYYKGVGYLFF